MSYRVRCSACGKIMTLEDDAAGESLVCVACGTRLEAPPPPGADLVEAHAEGGDVGWDQTEVPGVADARVAGGPTTTVTSHRPRPRPVDPAARSRNILLAVIGGGLVVIVVAVLLTAWIATGGPSRWSRDGSSANLRNNSDLLALKSEAEALAIQGRLSEAHEKYRKLQQLWSTRDIQDGLMWDIMERAKVDQDKIYTMLLNRMAPAAPDPRPGTTLSDGTVIPGGTGEGSSDGSGGGSAGGPAGSPGDAAGTGAPAPPAPDGAVPRGGYPPTYNGTLDKTAPKAAPRESTSAPPGDEKPEPPDARTAGASDAPSAPASGPAPQPRTMPQTMPRTQTRPAPANMPPPNIVSDAEIGDSLKRGIDYLIPQFKDGRLEEQPGLSPSKYAGLDALCVYSLLTSGQAMKDPRLDVRGDFLKKCLDGLKTLDLRSQPNAPQQHLTYARSLRAAALAVYNRPEDRKVLKEDVDWLVAAAVDGAYTYDERFTKGQAALVPSPLYPGERARVRSLWTLGVGSSTLNVQRPTFNVQPTVPLTPALSPESRGEGAQLLSLEYGGDGSVAVIPIHGPHDPRTGRELGMTPPMGRIGTSTLPRDSRYPLPNRYPQRTRPPGPMMPDSKFPPGAYGWGGGLPDAGPDPLPGRPGAPGSSSSVRFPWDNSNSQYGLLGVWSGAEVGVEVPVRYWKDVERHWSTCQLPGGEWAYKPKDVKGTLAMTSGGLASLFVTHDWLAAPMVKDNTGRPPLTRAILKGLAWMEEGDHCVTTPNALTHYFGYDLYGLERVGLASGYKYFGTHDWYRELAAKAVGTQSPDGSWGTQYADIDTAYTLLFLSRGRHPILMNKLQWDRSEVTLVDGKPAPGYWANRPRDLANLTRFAGRQLERGLNWQVVSLDVESSDWLDAPVLYIASHQAPGMEDADYEKLRQFVEAGGLIFTHADTGAGAFNRWVPKLVEKVYPGHQLEPLPEDHFVYNVLYKIKAPRPQLQAVSNGSRLLLVHSPADIASAWQQRSDKVYGDAFRLGVNLFVYAAGKADLRNRLNSPFIPEPVLDPQGSIQVARVKYGGNWDPEPGAWPRFRRYFEWQTQISVEHPPVELKDLKFDAAEKNGQAIAHLTGTAAYAFTDAEVAAAKAFVEAGGTLLIDPCGGSQAFGESVREGLLDKAFPGVKPGPLEPVLLNNGPDKGEKLVLKPRAFVSETLPNAATEAKALKAGAGVVIVSPLDLTSGLLGTNTWGVAGYEPDAAAQFVRNVLLWARGHGGEGQ